MTTRIALPRRGGLASTALALVLLAAPVVAPAQTRCDEAQVPQPQGCTRSNADVTVRMPPGENTERAGRFESAGFSISIDGETVAGAPAPANPDRSADIAATAVGLDLRFDGFDARRILNVSTADLRAAYRAGETVTFRTSTNYPAFLDRAEIRILDATRPGAPVVAVIPVAPNGTADWVMPSGGPGQLTYVLRVHDAAGRHDETFPLDLARSATRLDTHATTGPVIAAGEGEDRTRIRNIPVRGGLVTASGDGARPGGTLRVLGETVPVDATGRFVTSRILPVGDHRVAVEIDGRTLTREVTIPASDWFYVGIADLTFGRRFQDDLAAADPDRSDSFSEGRLAFYAKGRTARGYTVTASADTGNGELKDIFRRLDDKDPRKVLDRLDPEDGYPTFGDDSAAYDDAPTSGRVYLRIERDTSRLTWGDFRADLGAPGYLSSSRSLYGAELRFASPGVTEDGARRVRGALYAAQPDTLPQRDILRGTGGSVYFLSRQDINGASETVTVEVVDPVTGRILSSQTLVPGRDYEIDDIQGVLILSEPLASSASSSGLIGEGAGGEDAVRLVAQYEYTPTAGSLEGASIGGRVELRPAEGLRVGVTATREETGTADQEAIGADLRWSFGAASHLEAEIAQTDGPGFGRARTADGGLTVAREGAAGPRALAWRLGGRLDLTDLGLATEGSLGFFHERKEAGFSTLAEEITEDQTLTRLDAEVALGPRLGFGAEVERFTKAGGTRRTEAEIRLSRDINDWFKITGALGWLDKVTPGDAGETGERLDAALRLDFHAGGDLLYVFGQATLDDRGGLGSNNRIGAGLEARLGEKLRATGEVSNGDGGFGARARLTYAPTADNEVYFGYVLDPTRTGAGLELVGRDEGTFVLGGRHRQSDRVSTYAENTLDLFGARRSLTEGYGVTYTPDARWTFSAGAELGEVRDTVNGDFDRAAWSLGAAYAETDRTGRLRVEYRTEDGADPAQDRETWALIAGYETRVSDDWRLLAHLDALYSDGAGGAFRDGEYVEASVGYAYRPVLNERFNLLARYTYLRDLPGVDQIGTGGTTEGPLQVSHVFSIDGDYDLTPKLTLGAKYGFRLSEVAARGTDDFTAQRAHLGIVRLDWHVVHKWDVMGEVRRLDGTGGVAETGALLGVYRHVGNNAKVGIGYEWGRVSDDLTDLDYDARGAFVNIVAKF